MNVLLQKPKLKKLLWNLTKRKEHAYTVLHRLCYCSLAWKQIVQQKFVKNLTGYEVYYGHSLTIGEFGNGKPVDIVYVIKDTIIIMNTHMLQGVLNH